MLRASCDRCHRDKVKCQFEPGNSTCVRCAHRKGRCIRSPPIPPGRAKICTNAKLTAASRTHCQFTAGQMSGEEATGFARGDASQPRCLSTTHADTVASPEATGLAREDLLGNCWWGSPSFSEPSMPSWDLGNDYTHLPFSAAPSGSPSPSPSEPTPGWFAFEEVQGNFRHHPADHEMDVIPLCQCSVSLGRFLENGSHPCLSSKLLAFDVVLNTNRAITSAVRELAECRSLHPPDTMMLAYLLAQSVLASLHEAWWSSCRPGQRYPVPQPGSDSRQVFIIGSYRTDEEDSTVLRRQMVLLELERVQRTVYLLQEQTQMEPDIDGVHFFAIKMLVVEVQRIVNRISEGHDL